MSVPDASPEDVAEVFVEAWLDREAVDATGDFGPWIGRHAAALAGRSVSEVSDLWAVALAIDGIDADVRVPLRDFHLNEAPLPPDADRHELRLRRRVAHLGNDAVVAALLAQPAPWVDPDEDLVMSVRSRLRRVDAGGRVDAVPVAAEGAQDGDSVVVEPSRVTRSLRPVLLGLGGAIVVLFVAIVVLSAASGAPDPVILTEDLIPTGAIPDVEGGELSVTERDSGLLIDLDAPTLPRRGGDQFYEGVVILDDGTETAVGTFNAGFAVKLSAGVSFERVASFLVVTRELGTDVGDVVLKLDIPRT